MTVVFPHPLFSIPSPHTFRGRRGLFSRLLLAADCQAYCLLYDLLFCREQRINWISLTICFEAERYK